MKPPLTQGPPATTQVRFAARSDVGQVREVNQDAFFVGHTPQGVLALVADGMGGHQSGEVASQKAAEALCQALLKPQSHLPTAIAKAVQSANLSIYDYAGSHPESRGMGTTLTLLLMDDQVGLVGHVGDSRAYLVRNGEIVQLTQDHSWVADRVRQGLLSEEEAKRHGWRNIITNALGTAPEIKLDLSHVEVAPGDRLLLCSDGLTMLLPDELLLKSLQAPTPEEAAEDLVAQANVRGGPDNITAVVLFVDTVAPKPKRYALPKAPASVRLGETHSGLRKVEEAYPPKDRLGVLRRHPWYPYRFWILGCLCLFILFLFFSLR